jgi:DNA-directed RNA polymerase specialized sigma24 family protein
MTLNRFQNLDWTRLYKALTVQAAGILRHYRGPDTFDGGQDCQDVVAEVLKEFYRSPNGLGWKEGKGKLETYLGAVVHNRLVDRLRRQKHVGGSLDDPDFSPPAQQSRAAAAPERAKINIKDVLYSLVKGDAELEDLITAAELVEGGPNVNQELGQVLNKTPHQVSKLKERLLAIDVVKELYAARQAAKSTRPRA